MQSSLQNGKVICFPTETLYALAVDAYNLNAIKNLYSIKHRSPSKPFAIMVHNITLLDSLIEVNAQQLILIKRYTPGPVTFILTRKRHCMLPKVIGEKIGIRIPKHDIALDILKNFGGPLATTSANLSNEGNARCFSDIPTSILAKVDSYRKNDSKISGLGSTVIDITTNPITILRKGKITFDTTYL